MTRTIRRFFEARPESVGRARAFVTEILAEWGVSGRAEDIRLCVSELATNAVVHGTAPGHGFLVGLVVEGDVVRTEVHDGRARRPKARRATAVDTTGRGLALVDALADGWGVEERIPCGKLVWACFKTAGET
ncbi:ATP-binding protein [Streptomyces cacaoi]|nr:ATP-binding protein [Streptomyces cacaoi]NNG88726.1 ATP-binding protein [Streptomyces cacaoi]